MKKNTLRELLRHRRINYIADYDDTVQTLKSLEFAWSNLPEDITDDERYMFIELIENVVKLHNRLDSNYGSIDSDKN
ncbi:MAG TPA: hypothetical protein PLD54_01015 [Candidatus Levybacteria bacterium]|nr:hypothetical protein [Candidatus Levybacteria bacterium]